MDIESKLMLANGIVSANKPSAEEAVSALAEYMGVTVTRSDDGSIEVVKSSPETGDYTDPILWHIGELVSAGLWYYLDDKDLPHEAIASGAPTGWFDRDYFDFVEEAENG